jgi:uncharacterized protein YcnI
MRGVSFLGTAAFIVALSAVADAHVGIGPKQSQANATQTYTIRVPAEGTVPTTSLELEVPPGVDVVSVHAPTGVSYELRKQGARVMRIVWRMTLQPGAVAELSLVAKNPGPGQVFWKSHQHFADGTANHYDGPPGSRRPAIATTLTP